MARVTYAAGPGECRPASASPARSHASRPFRVGPGPPRADDAPFVVPGLPGLDMSGTGLNTLYAPGPGTDADTFPPKSGTRPYIVKAGACFPALRGRYVAGPGDSSGFFCSEHLPPSPDIVNAGPPPTVPSPGRKVSYSPGPGVSVSPNTTTGSFPASVNPFCPGFAAASGSESPRCDW